MNKKYYALSVIVFGLLFACMSMIRVVSFSYQIWMSSHWQEAVGDVTDEYVERVEFYRGHAFSPVIRYTYTFDGTSYHSSQVALGRFDFHTESSARQFLDSVISNDQKVTVFHSGDSSQMQSVLVRDFHSGIMEDAFASLLGIVIVLCGGFYYWHLVRIDSRSEGDARHPSRPASHENVGR